MAQAKSDYIVEVIGVDKAGAVMASVAQHMEGVETATAKATTAAAKHESVTAAINKSYLSMRAVAGDVARVVGAMVTHLKEGGRALQLDAQVNALAGAAEKVESLRQGVMGTLDTTTLQQHVLLLDRIGISAKQAADVGLFALAEAQRSGAQTGEVLTRVVQALATGEAGSFKALGVNAKTTADALRQMADIGAQSMDDLEHNVSVGVDKINASWGNLVSDMQTGWATFVYGVANGWDELISTLSRTTADSLPKMKELMRISEEIVSLESKISAQQMIGPAAVSDVVRLRVLQAQEKALRDFLAAQRASGIDPFARGGAAMGADAVPLGMFGDSSDIGAASGGGRGGRGGSGRRAGGGAAGPLMLPGQDFFDLIAGNDGGPTGNDRGNRGMGTGINPGEQLSATELAMTNFAATMLDVAQDVGEAFGGIGDAFGGMIDALTDSGAISKTGAAAKALAAVQLTALAAQAGVRAVYEFAEGLAAAARYEYWSAAQHFAASVQYGIVAGTNIAKAVSGVGGGSGARGGQDAAAMPQSGVDRERRQSGPTVIVVTLPGKSVGGLVMEGLNAAAAKGERIPTELLSADVRRQLDRASRAA